MDICAVQQHYLKQIGCSIRAVNITLEASFYEKWYPSAVIYMSMAQNDCFYRFRIKGKRLPVKSVHFLVSLELTTIQKNSMSFSGQQMT